MLISVIIPAYNAEATIKDAIESVFEQGYSAGKLELIIVNDGSTDNTIEILRHYEHQCKIITTDNKGVSHARNTGLSHSAGKYIQYLDSDDLLEKNKLKFQIEMLEKNQADVAYGDWQKFKTQADGGIQFMEIVSRSIGKRPELDLFTNFWCPPAAILYSRRICDVIGGWNIDLPVIQDARYLLDAALKGARFIYTPGLMAYYRVSEGGSLSSSNKWRFVNDCFTNAKEIYTVWKNDLAHDIEKKNAIIDVLRYCINEFSRIDSKKFQEALNIVLEIDSKYVPDRSKGMHYLSKWIGYRYAENLAMIKRRLF